MKRFVRVQSRIIVKVGPFCRKGLCSLLQPATNSTLIKGQRLAVERTSALVVRFPAKVLLGMHRSTQRAIHPFDIHQFDTLGVRLDDDFLEYMGDERFVRIEDHLNVFLRCCSDVQAIAIRERCAGQRERFLSLLGRYCAVDLGAGFARNPSVSSVSLDKGQRPDTSSAGGMSHRQRIFE